MNLRDHIIEWLESIGADGLMYPDGPRMPKADKVIPIEELESFMDRYHVIDPRRVPAYRHADGTYHTEPEPCFNCERGHRPECMTPDVPCYWYQSWLAHKGEEK